jgi:RNA polymerase sigma factor (TIGR02999 family)
LVDVENVQHWDSRGHFFAAAAEAMRRILVEQARRKGADKHGGGATRVVLSPGVKEDSTASLDLLAVNDALNELEEHDPQLASLVKLRFFAGLDHQDAAEAMGISRRAADRLWSLARVWLFRKLADSEL